MVANATTRSVRRGGGEPATTTPVVHDQGDLLEIQREYQGLEVLDVPLEGVVVVLGLVRKPTSNVIRDHAAEAVAKRLDEIAVVERPGRVAMHHDQRPTLALVDIVQAQPLGEVDVGCGSVHESRPGARAGSSRPLRGLLPGAEPARRPENPLGPHLAMRACVDGVVFRDLRRAAARFSHTIVRRAGIAAGNARVAEGLRCHGHERNRAHRRLQQLQTQPSPRRRNTRRRAGRVPADARGHALNDTMQRLSRTSQIIAMLARYRGAGILTGLDLGDTQEEEAGYDRAPYHGTMRYHGTLHSPVLTI